MYKRILALLNGPQTWRSVLSQVERLARGHDVEVTLLLVAESPASCAERWRTDLEARLEEHASALRNRGMIVTTAFRAGCPAQEVIEYARAHPADVIVMASPPRAA
jgi:nucleotide-binding universal stress UspA family protein